MANLKNTTIDGTVFRLPAGDTAARPTGTNGAQLRFNTETGKLEQFRPNVGEWIAPSNTGVIATGGDAVYDVNTEGTTYRVHVFTSTGTSTFSVLQGGEVEYLIVAGGGGGTVKGGGGSGGGGGAGGAIIGKESLDSDVFPVTVGAGGGGSDSTSQFGDNGGNSEFLSFIAIGGGSGAADNQPGADGGCGGGAGGSSNSPSVGGQGLQPTSSSGGFGNNGGDNLDDSGGGGGGAGAPGEDGGPATDNPGNGGIGISSQILGYWTFFAGGGAGSGANSSSDRHVGTGGLGGGGGTTFGKNAVPNTGGGGGAGYNNSVIPGGDGGSGIVVIRYPLRQNNPETAAVQDVRNGLVLDLDFAKPTVYSGSGSVVTDSRLNGSTGDITGDTTFTNSRTQRSAFNFVGNGGIQIEHNNLWVIEPSDSFSVVMWYYADSATQSESILFSHQRCNDPGFQLFVDSNSLGARVQDIINYNQDTTETWNNVVMTYNGTESTIRLYLNGQLVQSGQNTSGDWSSYDPGYSEVWLGKRYPCGQTDDFTGQIAFFRFYKSRQLSLEEIQKIYNYTRWRFGV